MPDAPAAPVLDTPGTAPVTTVPIPAAAPPKGVPSVTPPSPARQKVSDAIRKAAERGPTPEPGETPPSPPAGKEPPKPAPPAAPEKGKPAPEPPKPTAEAGKPTPEAGKPAEGPKPGEKTGPWQLKEKWEKEAKRFEKEVLDLRGKLAAIGDVESIQKRIEAAEARNKELEEEIRFTNYSKSQEYQEKYYKPYEDRYREAVEEVVQFPVTLPDGSTRPATPQDFQRIAFAPPAEGRRLANEMFGDMAEDVIAHVRAVRELAKANQKALDDARKAGSEREQQMTQQRQQVTGEVTKLFHTFAQEDQGKYEFLQPKEGDEEWNKRLETASQFVDRAMASNSTDPKLTPEQRAELVKQHAAIRGRAVGFTMLKLENTRLKAQLAERDKKLAEYAEVEPGAGTAHAAGGEVPASTDPFDRVRQKIRGMARPGQLPV